MKRISLLLSSALATVALLGCSSMQVEDEQQLLTGIIPTDFQTKTFLELNPDVAAAQASAWIFGTNAAFKDSLLKTGMSAEDFAVFQAADEATFLANEATLAFLQQQLNTAVVGVADMTNDQKNALLRFNMWGAIDGYGANQEMQFVQHFLAHRIDEELGVQSYATYGIQEGRPYRACAPAELAGKLRSLELLTTNPNYKVNGFAPFRFCKDPASSAIHLVATVP